MRIEAAKRQKKPARRLPEQEIREAFRDGRVWARKAQVIEPNGEGSHYTISADPGTGARTVLVEVMTLPEGEDLTCQLATKPVWYIPPPGTVVLVSVPSGEIDHCPAIIGIEDSGDADGDIGSDRTLIASEVDIVVKAPQVKLGGAGASERAVLGDSQKDALSSFVDSLNTYASVIQSIADPSTAATTILSTAITLLKTQLGASLSPKVKLE